MYHQTFFQNEFVQKLFIKIVSVWDNWDLWIFKINPNRYTTIYKLIKLQIWCNRKWWNNDYLQARTSLKSYISNIGTKR